MDQESSPWAYKPDNGKENNNQPESRAKNSRSPKSYSVKSVGWEAAEFVDNPHGSGWYAGLVISTVALAAIVYFVAKDIIATVTIIVVGAIVGVFANQKPSQVKYEINEAGLSINDKVYRYSDYKSFTILREGNLSSVNLFPLKRFMPPLSAYFEAPLEKKIVDALGNYLPYEERKLDNIDRLSRRLRL